MSGAIRMGSFAIPIKRARDYLLTVNPEPGRRRVWNATKSWRSALRLSGDSASLADEPRAGSQAVLSVSRTGEAWLNP